MCESYREGRFIRNRTLLSLGDLESVLPPEKIPFLCKRINQVYFEGKTFIISSLRDDKVEALCIKYVGLLHEAQKIEKARKKAAGIATNDNLKMLKEESFDYFCVSRGKLKEYRATSLSPVEIRDKSNQLIEISQVEVDGECDSFYKVKSYSKGLKEASMENRFTRAFECGLSQAAEALKKKGGTKKLEKVWERIGRLKEKYPSVHRLYQIHVEPDERGIHATSISWERIEAKSESRHGEYFLRTSLSVHGEEITWLIYNTIREVESTFRCLKTDLNLRPVFHKTDEATMAHLHLGLLAYQLVSTIRYKLKQFGITHEWREIVRIMNTQKMVTTHMVNTDEECVSIRKCSLPESKVRIIYKVLGYDEKPFIRKKSVVPQLNLKKIYTQGYRELAPVSCNVG